MSVTNERRWGGIRFASASAVGERPSPMVPSSARRWLAAVAAVGMVAAMTAMVGCGGDASTAATAGAGPSTSTGGDAMGATAPPPAGGSAREGAACDYGGADSMTCSGGLICCYPEGNDAPHGSCRGDCPGYD